MTSFAPGTPPEYQNAYNSWFFHGARRGQAAPNPSDYGIESGAGSGGPIYQAYPMSQSASGSGKTPAASGPMSAYSPGRAQPIPQQSTGTPYGQPAPQQPSQSSVLKMPSQEDQNRGQAMQRWRSAGSPGYTPEKQQYTWEQLNSLPAARQRDSQGNIGAGLSSTPQYQDWRQRAARNAAAEQNAFQQWQGGGESQAPPMSAPEPTPSPRRVQPVPVQSQGAPYGQPAPQQSPMPRTQGAPQGALDSQAAPFVSGFPQGSLPTEAFRSTAYGLDGQKMDFGQSMQQRDALIHLLNENNAQYQMRSGVGNQFGPAPQAPNLGSMWEQAGRMVQQGWQNPFAQQ